MTNVIDLSCLLTNRMFYVKKIFLVVIFLQLNESKQITLETRLELTIFLCHCHGFVGLTIFPSHMVNHVQIVAKGVEI